MSIPKPGAAVAASKAKVDVAVSPEVEAVEVSPKVKKIAVEAIEKGFIDNSRKNPGDKFFISSEKAFSKNWMKKI